MSQNTSSVGHTMPINTKVTPESSSKNTCANQKPSVTLSAVSDRQTSVLLSTALVDVISKTGKTITVKALLDSGSQSSFITQSLANKLQCETYDHNLSISSISQTSFTTNKMTNIAIHSRQQNKQHSVSCIILKNITYKLPQIPINIDKLKIPQEIEENLADSTFHLPSDIELLLGADIYYAVLTGGCHKLGKNMPTLINTDLGWLIGGTISDFCTISSNKQQNNASQDNVSFFLQVQDIDSSLQKFWDIEEVYTKPKLSNEEQLAENIFVQTTKILKNGSFQVEMPFKNTQENKKLGDSYRMAETRFLSLEKRLVKNPNLFLEYKKFIDEYIELGHAAYVPLNLTNKNNDNKYFIPHLCVVRESSSTTKLRVVFDASAKTSTGVSLNDVTLKGYQVQPELFDILCRFRYYQFVLISDIQKMYRQIKIHPEQTFLQNILWRDNPQDTLKCIELQTVTYGTNFAPFAATRVISELATLGAEDFPLASKILHTQCYVDDILAGCNDFDQLSTLYAQLNTLLNNSGFKLHKWGSNSSNFLNSICQKSITEYDLNFDKEPNKVLGVKWIPDSDFLKISIPNNLNNTKPTKRNILSTIAQCYDPLGLVNPVVVKGKILMQKLWIQKLDWDTEITSLNLLNEWNDFLNMLTLLNTLQIPRKICDQAEILKIELHGFADASTVAYGACVYVRTLYKNNLVTNNLISSKSRVAPIKTITLPRLELCALTILANLINKMVSIFQDLIDFSSVNLWSDSKIVLAWCNDHPNKWSTFVSHRVSQIQSLTENCKIRYVKSADNPADILSRGNFSNEIINSGFWFHGPKFLLDKNTNLDSFNAQPNVTNIPEQKKIALSTVKIPEPCEFWIEYFSRFSTFTKLMRSVAFILRFINNIKNKNNKIQQLNLTISEIENSTKFIVKNLQNHYFAKEILELKNNSLISSKQLRSLKLFLDSEQMLRVGGRLHNANITFDQKHPYLLPSHNETIKIMLKQEHLRMGHAGSQTVLSNFRLRYWPLNGLRETKQVIRNCVTCARFRVQPAQQIMADLPGDRVQIAQPFQKVGIDYGGPFLIKSSRLKKAPVLKAYIAIFVCMTTKAVHIELVTSLTTESFIMTLKRFISRRGNPTIIYSDNATNFQGSNNQLIDIYNFFQNSKNHVQILDYLSTNEIQWKFIPPRSPHWGGLWEAAIKSTKYHIKRIIGNLSYTFEEFYTILTQIEAILNSRPLCPLTNDPSDFDYLTPGHFLIGKSLTIYPDKNISEIPENRLKFWQQCTKIQQVFWKRWSVSYLNHLQNCPKWLKVFKNISPNDVVLLREDNVPPLQWPLARVLEVYPGKDNKVRVLKLKTPTGVFTRSITKVSPLFYDDSNISVNINEN